MEYIKVERVDCSDDPAQQDKARKDLIDFVVNDVLDGDKKVKQEVKVFVGRLHDDEVASYLVSLKTNCPAVKAEISERVLDGYLKNTFMKVRYVFFLARRNIKSLIPDN